MKAPTYVDTSTGHHRIDECRKNAGFGGLSRSSRLRARSPWQAASTGASTTDQTTWTLQATAVSRQEKESSARPARVVVIA